ncbi:thiamine pyrophosphate-binding protein [Celerinatantimonas diazotrophica]|uniref:2-succinyl-5-enolpyruvyl-6-hydroxy-3-cyclohexene-1-carboxylate synthase n=1 Tax=Celerinatantimonas diazotrophica TaxID=412034 RepID=A0A4R1K558_9GAMM|nr:thiamine pyrophosphate-binding protein [Celerinatantimonas diazotrophica]TCK59080.1 2-succinyl-5-enolpyruvyl-6-hydroxy-3-cyclohexene-1-carboxylate synthase [Celerinatantimonas diazotrophica]CAG9297718.1 2-succinyl-5-enolpyruvyl-6-hydroxy-3-cyclohexene-1-carboxylate synthase [Celerinatantimonas diazotrophica]
MRQLYTDEKNAQVVVALLKKHNIKQIIASPGTTNVALVRCLQIDPFFKIYSAVDERSAAYMACGLAAESNNPVVLSCTGATASRNYLPGLTEAFYRKLPILAITSTRDRALYGHHEDQVIDRTSMPKDVAKLSVHLPTVKDRNDIWECRIKTNQAILELYRNGGGPVHINLTTVYTRSYTTKKLPDIEPIYRFTTEDKFPTLSANKIGIFIGSHKLFTEDENNIIDRFCESNNAVVFCDHTSGYRGNYGVKYLLPLTQFEMNNSHLLPELLIHIGEISGFYHPFVSRCQVWRINEDGEIRDTFKKLKYIFEMSEFSFFKKYTSESGKNLTYYNLWQDTVSDLYKKMPNLVFSNLWVAEQLSPKIPKNSNIHFGILNSLTSWNYFDVDRTINCNSNVGGFGIDGGVSALLGASLYDKNKIYFGIFGDLAFFYDMNAIGNRYLSNNLRILIINNGMGIEFKIKNNPAVQFGDETDLYVAGAGHFGNKSPNLIKDYAINLGFDYITASNKDEFNDVFEKFITPDVSEKPILFEVFTDDVNEQLAEKQIRQIERNFKGSMKSIVKHAVGDKQLARIKKIVK